MYRAIDGSVLNAALQILDDNDQPVVPIAGYPKVYLLDQDKTPLGSFVASPSLNPGEWQVSIALPYMGLKKSQEHKIKWVTRATDGEKYRDSDTVLIDPKHDKRASEIVLMNAYLHRD